MTKAKTINGGNYYEADRLQEMKQALEAGDTIAINISCIGHTRARFVEECYAVELRKAYGDSLIEKEYPFTKYSLKK